MSKIKALGPKGVFTLTKNDLEDLLEIPNTHKKGVIYLLKIEDKFKVGTSKDFPKRYACFQKQARKDVILVQLFSDGAGEFEAQVIEDYIHRGLTELGFHLKKEWYHETSDAIPSIKIHQMVLSLFLRFIYTDSRCLVCGSHENTFLHLNGLLSCRFCNTVRLHVEPNMALINEDGYRIEEVFFDKGSLNLPV